MLDRRGLFTSLAAAPLMTVLADPILSAAAAATMQTVSLTTPGGRDVKASLAQPAATPAPAIMVIHEWWGLNSQIKSVAAELAKEGYLALAIDLYDGKSTSDADKARSLMRKVKQQQGTDIVTAWIDWLKTHELGTGKVATIGWCFGGSWSMNASLATPVDATVIYYGQLSQSATQVAKLNGPVLGHFATNDTWVNEPMVDGFTDAMDEAGKPYEAHWYEAYHAFFNPTRPSYDEDSAKLSWERTLAFLKKNLS